MKRSASNVISAKIDKPQYEFFFRYVNKTGKTVKGAIEMMIKRLEKEEAHIFDSDAPR